MTTRVGTPPVAAAPGSQGAEGDKLNGPIASPRSWVIGGRKPYQIANRPAVRMLRRRSRQAGELTIQQIRWSDDAAWLRGILQDPERGPAYRAAAAKRLRKLGARRPRL